MASGYWALEYWHYCNGGLAQIRWGRGPLGISALREWPPVTGWEGRLRVGISATLCWPFPWSVSPLALLRGHDGSK